MRNGLPVVCSVLRHDLVRMLSDSLPAGHTHLHLGRAVSGAADAVSVAPDGAYLAFADGSRQGPYDLVVGADGIRSRVRAAAFAAAEPPIYSGIRIVFGVCGGSSRATPTEIHQWFGDGIYGLAFTAGKGAGKRDVLAVCQRDSRGSVAGENPDWDAAQVRWSPSAGACLQTI